MPLGDLRVRVEAERVVLDDERRELEQVRDALVVAAFSLSLQAWTIAFICFGLVGGVFADAAARRRRQSASSNPRRARLRMRRRLRPERPADRGSRIAATR